MSSDKKELGKSEGEGIRVLEFVASGIAAAYTD
jgi:hypothetical protein